MPITQNGGGRGRRDFEWLKEKCRRGHPRLQSLAAGGCSEAHRERAGLLFREVISYLYERSMPVVVGGEFKETVAPLEIYGFLDRRQERMKRAAIDALEACGEPVDDWHQAAACALLIAPHLAGWTIPAQVGLGPRPDGQTDIESQAVSAVGTSMQAERHGTSAKRDMQKRLGYERRGRKRGPKPGSKKITSDARMAFDQHVQQRRLDGVAVQMIAEDAEAVRLYQEIYGGDPARRPSEGTIRRAIRKSKPGT